MQNPIATAGAAPLDPKVKYPIGSVKKATVGIVALGAPKSTVKSLGAM